MTDKTTILFLAANPVDTDALRLGEELREIKAALARATQRDRFDLQSEAAVRIEDLRRVMLRHRDQPVIVHFAGHGGAGAIYLEGPDGHARPVAGGALGRFLALFPNVRCVILNACYSDELADALAEVAPCVVGMEVAVTDPHAILFAVAFYDGIGEGLSYADAFRIAESAVDLAGVRDAVRPVFKAGKAAPPLTPTGDNSAIVAADFPPLVVPRLDDITGKQHGALADALTDAFSEQELGQMVRVKLDKNLAVIAGGPDYGAVAFILVDWAKRSGYLRELVQGAVETQPRNQKLRAFALAVGAKVAD
jgi:hypothetical protein